jgi:hypothetical protein
MPTIEGKFLDAVIGGAALRPAWTSRDGAHSVKVVRDEAEDLACQACLTGHIGIVSKLGEREGVAAIALWLGRVSVSLFRTISENAKLEDLMVLESEDLVSRSKSREICLRWFKENRVFLESVS